MHIIKKIVSGVIVALVGFVAGAYAMAMGYVPPLFSDTVRATSAQGATSGTVAAIGANELTIAVPGGSTQVFALSPATKVESVAPQPRALSDVAVGQSVIVFSSTPGKADSIGLTTP